MINLDAPAIRERRKSYMKAKGVLGIHNPAPKFVERRERVNVTVLVGPSITAEIQVAQVYVARNEDSQ